MTLAECAKELVVLGLRTKLGVSLSQARALYSPLDDLLDFKVLASYAENGFITGSLSGTSHIAPTEKGLAVIDSILSDILKF
ncbi:hypothetical protein DSO57_1014203 [Entomophthora muscae]|nr:hypothetical protein DSO57_1014203 [Entomophthora muscae]